MDKKEFTESKEWRKLCMILNAEDEYFEQQEYNQKIFSRYLIKEEDDEDM